MRSQQETDTPQSSLSAYLTVRGLQIAPLIINSPCGFIQQLVDSYIVVQLLLPMHSDSIAPNLMILLRFKNGGIPNGGWTKPPQTKPPRTKPPHFFAWVGQPPPPHPDIILK